ncbi:MAG: peptide-methionine (S)-S-oxide reductase, partial [Rhodobiaceae bacterium]
PSRITLNRILKTFFEEHDPTQGYRQGNDFGTQYRSAIFGTSTTQVDLASQVAADYGAALAGRGLGEITTEIGPAGPFYYAEDYHQQYLHKVPNGYCGLKGTGVACAG